VPFWKNLVAGGGAGVLEVVIMYPLDVVKTRSQLSTTSQRGVLATLQSIVREEGFARLYRGLSSPIVAEAPKRAAKFTFNEKYKQLLGQEHYAMAGTLAGMSEALVNCPFEVVKVRMQAKENLGKYASTFQGKKKNKRKKKAECVILQRRCMRCRPTGW
jgi:solute carrier family 25 2-oxodicarboxylate transporter 21